MLKLFLHHIGYILFANLPALIFFKFLSSLKVRSDAAVPIEKNLLIVSNHRSLVDSWLIIYLIFNKIKCLFHYRYLPYHPAAVEHFFNTSWKRLLFGRLLKCLPLYRKSRIKQIFATLNVFANKLREGTMIIFAEGTRTRTERMIADSKFGVGYIMYQAKPVVIPLYHNGTEKILPVGATKLSPFHTVSVWIGKPIDLRRFYEMPNEKNTWRKISEHVFQRLLDMEKEFYEA